MTQVTTCPPGVRRLELGGEKETVEVDGAGVGVVVGTLATVSVVLGIVDVVLAQGVPMRENPVAKVIHASGFLSERSCSTILWSRA